MIEVEIYMHGRCDGTGASYDLFKRIRMPCAPVIGMTLIIDDVAMRVAGIDYAAIDSDSGRLGVDVEDSCYDSRESLRENLKHFKAAGWVNDDGRQRIDQSPTFEARR